MSTNRITARKPSKPTDDPATEPLLRQFADLSRWQQLLFLAMAMNLHAEGIRLSGVTQEESTTGIA